MWDFIEAEDLIRLANAGNYGLAPRKWTEQLEQIRGLPEAPHATDEQQPTEET